MLLVAGVGDGAREGDGVVGRLCGRVPPRRGIRGRFRKGLLCTVALLLAELLFASQVPCMEESLLCEDPRISLLFSRSSVIADVIDCGASVNGKAGLFGVSVPSLQPLVTSS